MSEFWPFPTVPFTLLLQGLTIFATITLATTGVLQAARNGMDIFGALILASVCALGGGTARDLLIGAIPVFWMTDLLYLYIILPTTLMVAWLVRLIPPGKGIRYRLLDVADALGLALFSILGAQKALAFGVSDLVAISMGVMTGIAGGMMRDVLSGQIPAVMRGGMFYASASIIGTIMYVNIVDFTSATTAVAVSILVIFLVRLAAIRFKLKLPTLKHPS